MAPTGALSPSSGHLNSGGWGTVARWLGAHACLEHHGTWAGCGPECVSCLLTCLRCCRWGNSHGYGRPKRVPAGVGVRLDAKVQASLVPLGPSRRASGECRPERACLPEPQVALQGSPGFLYMCIIRVDSQSSWLLAEAATSHMEGYRLSLCPFVALGASPPQVPVQPPWVP